MSGNDNFATVQARIASEVWEQAKTAYASGIGLRELARKMSIPEGTMLARARRAQWTGGGLRRQRA